MRRSVLTLIILAFLWLEVSNAKAEARRIIDLTHSFSSETVYWPTAEGFKLVVDAAGFTKNGYYYAANSFCGAEHGGTHIDAPIHFAEGKPSVDEIELERLIAPGILVDVTANAAGNRDYLVRIEDFLAWEKKHGRIPEGNIVLIRTGWGRHYPRPEDYLGTVDKGADAVSDLHFPGLEPATARWLTEKRSIAAVGLDTASIDYGQSTLFESHRALFEAGIPAFENVANLEKLPEKDFEVIALPMKIAGGSGGPLRIVAILGQ